MSENISIQEGKYVNTKRLTSYWDPVYNSNGDDIIKSEWIFSGITGVTHRLYEANELFSSAENFFHPTFRGISFAICDFRGDFIQKKITFNNCNFNKCDFGYSTWKNVKFSGCTFTDCSFTLVSFVDSQFIECKWTRIGISGNETRFATTTMSNPEEFINSGYTNTKDTSLLSQKSTSASFQKMRLEESKAKLSKVLLNSIDSVGDDDSYYNAVKCCSNQKISEKIMKSKHEIFSRKNVILNNIFLNAFRLEKIIVNFSGAMNGWGNNVALPVAIGGFIIMIYSVLYLNLGFAGNYKQASLMAFDVTFLFGYTKHATAAQDFWRQISYASNAFLGLWWYAVLVPTIINRISRIR